MFQRKTISTTHRELSPYLRRDTEVFLILKKVNEQVTKVVKIDIVFIPLRNKNETIFIRFHSLDKTCSVPVTFTDGKI